MVKTTYALTLFAAVSLAAPVQQLDGRAIQKDSAEHENLIEELPLVGSLLGSNHGKRATERPEHHNVIDEIPILNKLIGSGQQRERRDIVSEGISGLPLVGGLFGKHEVVNGKNGKRDLASSLNGIPIVGELLGMNQDKPSHQQTETPAKRIDTRQNAGDVKGVFRLLHSLTSGGPVTQSHKRDEVHPNEAASPKANGAQQSNQPGSDAQKGKEDKNSGGLLAGLMGPKGLGGIKGNSEHGLGLFPMRRDTNQLETRQSAPIQGSTLTDVVLQGGVFGKVTKLLTPGAPEHKPGQNSPTNMGDGSTAGPPDPASGAGPHSGPGLAAEQSQRGASQ
ncbi:hypothetical protein N7457_005400 [Penicillium paradoxum]|uniref:uncharacterized protein n=1 Tax=Penicillium paradoxum TaxID=176176 RepID=UPI002548F0D2|nr:uncharacterized protein N7457_005400 [Penicillium paradoxum]KAJ5780240.1 hypothetical protein N7457_005400 [Penicillium paradoxum]